jgi:hypothetical protein
MKSGDLEGYSVDSLNNSDKCSLRARHITMALRRCTVLLKEERDSKVTFKPWH